VVKKVRISKSGSIKAKLATLKLCWIRSRPKSCH